MPRRGLKSLFKVSLYLIHQWKTWSFIFKWLDRRGTWITIFHGLEVESWFQILWEQLISLPLGLQRSDVCSICTSLFTVRYARDSQNMVIWNVLSFPQSVNRRRYLSLLNALTVCTQLHPIALFITTGGRQFLRAQDAIGNHDCLHHHFNLL